MPGRTPAALATEMLIHHNVVISQRLRELSGGMREPWQQHGTGGRQAGGQRSGAKEGRALLYWGLGSEINRPGHLVDVDVSLG